MKKFSLLVTALLFSFLLYAQNKPGKISGSVTNTDKKPVESATIQLLKADNKALVKAAITDKAGNFEQVGPRGILSDVTLIVALDNTLYVVENGTLYRTKG